MNINDDKTIIYLFVYINLFIYSSYKKLREKKNSLNSVEYIRAPYTPRDVRMRVVSACSSKITGY